MPVLRLELKSKSEAKPGQLVTPASGRHLDPCCDYIRSCNMPAQRVIRSAWCMWCKLQWTMTAAKLSVQRPGWNWRNFFIYASARHDCCCWASVQLRWPDYERLGAYRTAMADELFENLMLLKKKKSLMYIVWLLTVLLITYVCPGPKNPFLCPDGRVATGEGRLAQWRRTKLVLPHWASRPTKLAISLPNLTSFGKARCKSASANSTRMQNLRLGLHQNAFGGRAPPGPAGGAKALPQAP